MQKADYSIAYDLGTGGIKASLFDMEGRSLFDTFSQYNVVYTGSDFHEQAPDIWYDGICATTKLLLDRSGVNPASIWVCLFPATRSALCRWIKTVSCSAP
jgi:xylulokinase